MYKEMGGKCGGVSHGGSVQECGLDVGDLIFKLQAF